MNNHIDSQDLECPHCPLCGSEEKDKLYDKFNPYSVVLCRSCGVYYLLPRLKEHVVLKIYRDSEYFEDTSAGYTSYIEQEKSLRATFRRLMINLKKRNVTGGDLLEVGCGYGYLLDEASSFFETRTGTEFSIQAVTEASSKADHIYQGGIEQIPVDKKFDCIIINQVIEHVYKPVEFLETLITHLNPGGRMVIATPDMGSFWRRVMGHHWPSFKIPEHILFFDKHSLHKLMGQVGLLQIKSLPYSHAFPLSLIAAKLNISLPAVLGKINMWLPATTIAMYGVLNDG